MGHPDQPTTRVEQIVVVEFKRGRGTPDSPVRLVTAYYRMDGTVLVEFDPCVTP